MPQTAFQRMTAEEYLRTERESEYKREYVDGFVYPLYGQAGASKLHVRITNNITFALYAAAEKVGCRIYASEMKLMPTFWRSFYYPDVMVCCGPENSDPYMVSPSSDRTGKFAAYTALPSLQTYLLVEQGTRRIYAYARAGAEWVLTEYDSGVIPLPCLDMGLDVEAVYRGLVEG